jgi:hypothetical protein
MEIYDIDLVRAVFTSVLDDESIFMTSFYESLEDPDALERYGKKVWELANEQNKVDYKARGVVYQQGEADIVNIKSRYMCPFAYGLRLDVAMEDRDYVNAKLLDLIENVKGRKFDIAIGGSGEKYVSVSPHINSLGKMELADNVYINYTGTTYKLSNEADWDNLSADIFGGTKSWYRPSTHTSGEIVYTVYMEVYGATTLVPRQLYRVEVLVGTEGGGYADIVKADLLETTITKRKATMSINGLQKTEPFMTSGVERVMILLSGQATITDEYVMLGNDIIETYIKVGSGSYYLVEPLEMPTSVKVGDTNNTYNSVSSPKGITHNNTIENAVSYTFNIDKSNALLTSFMYLALNQSFVSPLVNENSVFTILNYDYQFGTLVAITSKAKLDDINIMNTPADILNLKVMFKLGDY